MLIKLNNKIQMALMCVSIATIYILENYLQFKIGTRINLTNFFTGIFAGIFAFIFFNTSNFILLLTKTKKFKSNLLSEFENSNNLEIICNAIFISAFTQLIFSAIIFDALTKITHPVFASLLAASLSALVLIDKKNKYLAISYAVLGVFSCYLYQMHRSYFLNFVAFSIFWTIWAFYKKSPYLNRNCDDILNIRRKIKTPKIVNPNKMSNVDFLKNYFDKNKNQLLEDFFTFLRFESISTDSAYKSQVLDCASWLAKYIRNAGMDVELWETVRYPIVFAEWKDKTKELPTVLIYFHYDVQPVDPIELWTNPPFEPTLKDGEIYARGAMDDKGQAFYVIAALKALLERDGKLPVNVKLCIEGEEECGSQGIKSVLEAKSQQLKADHFFVVDLGIHAMDKPAVTLGIRGITTFTVELTGSNTDLHSGTHGGVAYNPLHALVEILGKMRARDGKVLIPGFYDDVLTLSEEDKRELDLSFDLEEYKQVFGGLPNGGESEFSPIESSWLRPTLEINGIGGGYSGEGFKTVIPAKATAKISCRLVPNMDPEKITNAVINFIRANTPEGIEVKIHADGQGAALITPLQTPGVKAVKEAFEDVTGHKTSYILSGGSIPIAEKLAKAANAKTVLFGYGLPGDNLHAPNEHFGVERIKLGMATVGRALELLGK